MLKARWTSPCPLTLKTNFITSLRSHSGLDNMLYIHGLIQQYLVHTEACNTSFLTLTQTTVRAAPSGTHTHYEGVPQQPAVNQLQHQIFLPCVCTVCMYVRMYVCMYVCMHVCMYVHTFVCMYVCMHTCMCV